MVLYFVVTVRKMAEMSHGLGVNLPLVQYEYSIIGTSVNPNLEKHVSLPFIISQPSKTSLSPQLNRTVLVGVTSVLRICAMPNKCRRKKDKHRREQCSPNQQSTVVGLYG